MPSQCLRQRKYKLIFQEIFPLYVQFIIPLRESLLPPLPSCGVFSNFFSLVAFSFYQKNSIWPRSYGIHGCNTYNLICNLRFHTITIFWVNGVNSLEITCLKSNLNSSFHLAIPSPQAIHSLPQTTVYEKRKKRKTLRGWVTQNDFFDFIHV